MPTAPTYPGVYIEEIPSGVRTITGVSTSVAAFIDFFPRGPINEAVQLFSQADFDRVYGGLHPQSEASYAIQQFFLNGGSEAWVVRCASGTPEEAEIGIHTEDGTGTDWKFEAANPGKWANGLRMNVDPQSSKSFDLTVSETSNDNKVLRQEAFRSLTVDPGGNNAKGVLNEDSQLVRVADGDAAGGPQKAPRPTGTLSGKFDTFTALGAQQTDRSVNVSIANATDNASAKVNLGKAEINSLRDARDLLQAGIRAAQPGKPSFAQATVEIYQPQPVSDDPNPAPRLRVLAGPSQPDVRVTFGAPAEDPSTATALKLTGPGVVANVQAYTVKKDGIADTGQAGGKLGDDGTVPDATAIQTALQKLKDVDFNILCVPRAAEIGEAQRNQVIAAATAYCEQRRAFFLVDVPKEINTLQEARDWSDTLPHSRNAAAYFPRVKIADPLSGFRLRSVGASGTMAGVYARTDAQRGVWKAPAGTDATLLGVQGLDYALNDSENGALNPLGINTLRTFPVYGTVAWGARTLRGADALADEYKYIPVRRVALMIEESLYRGTKWVVFEPNDEALWSQIRLNVGAFMQNLFRQGAFQGTSPRDAYFVKCDKDTTTQNDINLGIVNILVGFAPLKPAEFVVIKLQQMAGQVTA